MSLIHSLKLLMFLYLFICRQNRQNHDCDEKWGSTSFSKAWVTMFQTFGVGGAISRPNKASDMRFIGRGFAGRTDSGPGQATYTCVLLSPNSITLVPVKRRWRSEAGKVRDHIVLATHWPCVTDFVVYPPTGSRKAHVREMSTQPKLTIWHARLAFTF